MANVRWGIIGCGDVTEVKSGPAFQKADGSELVAVMRRTGALAEDYARRHGVPRWYDDADEILRADDIDAVYIATHTNSHLEYAVRAAAAGKAVYVEKPMAMDEAECMRMQAACDRAGVPLWVAYYRRALPRFEKIRALIGDGEIGEVRAVTIQRALRVPDGVWQNQAGLSRGGFFLDSACHALDYLDSLFGGITEVKAMGSRHGREKVHGDVVSASYEFESGVIGTASWGFDSAADLDVTTIVGTAGSLSFSVSTPDPVRLRVGGETREFVIPDPAHVHQPLVQTIVDEFTGKGACPSTGATAIRTARAMDRILADIS